MNPTIAIIGGGNLGSAIAEGLLSSQFIAPSALTVTKRNLQSLAFLATQQVTLTSDNVAAVQQAQYIILCLKPFQTAEVLQSLKAFIDPKKQVVISCVTGVWLNELKTLLPNVPLVRAMPNTAIAVKQSMTCLCQEGLQQQQVEFVQQLFHQLGQVVFLDEKLMDAATVLGACGTAFAMRYIRANIQGGIEIGFNAATASLIAAQTVLGAAQLLIQKNTHPEQEIDKVTTPKGCTIVGLNEMEHNGFSSSLIKGIRSSYQKITNDM